MRVRRVPGCRTAAVVGVSTGPVNPRVPECSSCLHHRFLLVPTSLEIANICQLPLPASQGAPHLSLHLSTLPKLLLLPPHLMVESGAGID